MKILKGGIIGCGFFSVHHVEAWRRMGNVQIVAACDPVIERASAVAQRAYDSAEKMLNAERLDFVDIVTRSTEHLELISLAAAKGLAIICQKPMAPDFATASRMVEVAESHRVRFMIHDNWRWQPWYRAARTIIARGDIGTPVSFGFRCRCKDGLGETPYLKQAYFRQLRHFIIDETLVHHIDTARFIFGDIVSIYAEAVRRNSRIAGEDHAILTVRHNNGVFGWIDGHSFTDHEESGPSLDETTFEGESGSIRITGLGEIWSGSERIWTDGSANGYRGDSVYAAQAHFIDCMETGAAFESEARDYLEKTFSVVEAAYESISSRHSVDVASMAKR